MTKAKLIKREEVIELQQARAAQKAQKQAVRKVTEVVGDWIDNRRARRIDPRAAFAALKGWRCAGRWSTRREAR